MRSPSQSPPDTLPCAFSSSLTTLDPSAERSTRRLEVSPTQGDSGGPTIPHLPRSTAASKVSYLTNLPSRARGANKIIARTRNHVRGTRDHKSTPTEILGSGTVSVIVGGRLVGEEDASAE
ncbi:hypothetical protein Psuf_010430 [Phytohabitans suffuscus]|uniref:Uncharacterized protein n=1 Tax=Phytohabitans suffuscus TaxID=624315 RepID=A0A6F8YCE1_9ACTN|nr:hypothetical protein Psuf_010430 [Phytohabitans suffuscus]